MCPPAKVMTNKARISGVGTRIEEILQQGNDSSAEMSRTEVTIHLIPSLSHVLHSGKILQGLQLNLSYNYSLKGNDGLG